MLCPRESPLAFTKTCSIISDNYKTFFFISVRVITCFSGLYIVYVNCTRSVYRVILDTLTDVQQYRGDISRIQKVGELASSSCCTQYYSLQDCLYKVSKSAWALTQLWKNALRSSYGGALSWCKWTSWKGGMFSECAPPPRPPGGPKGRLWPGRDVLSPE